MHQTPPGLETPPEGYAAWLAELKGCIHTAQQRATLSTPDYFSPIPPE